MSSAYAIHTHNLVDGDEAYNQNILTEIMPVDSTFIFG